MTSGFPVPRHVITLGIAVLLAIVIGFLLATPQDLGSWAVVLAVAGVLALPIFLKWHYPILVFSWNAAIVVPLVPGQPNLWMGMACGSLFMSVLAYVMDRQNRLQEVRPLTITLLVLAGVVLATALATGGLGVKALGGEIIGGRKYFTILFAIIGYFALSCRKIPYSQAETYMGLYLLSGLTLALGNLAYLGGESFWWLFNLIPVDYVMNQATEDFTGISRALKFGRLSGVTWAMLAVFSWMLVKFGLRGILDMNRPWRAMLAVLLFGISLMGGFRSIVVIYIALVVIQAFMEGLHRTRLMPAMLLVGLLGYVLLIPTAQLLPLSVQRSLTVLPFVPVHPAAEVDAQASTDWRLRMWQVLIQEEVPRHILLGKGYTSSAADYWLSVEAFRRGFSEDFEMSLVAGDYHNGPLSVLIPFGIWGVLAFGAFIYVAVRSLWRNYRYGPPALKRINTFIFSYFMARLLFFLTVFGGISTDCWLFAGLVGMSVAINHGVTRPPDLGQEEKEEAASAEPAEATV